MFRSRRHRLTLLLPGLLLLLPIGAPARADLDPKARKEVVEAATKYFDLGEDLWRGRTAFRSVLGRLAQRTPAYDLLGDLPALRKVIYAARYFEPQMSDKRWQKQEGITEYDNKGNMYHIRGEGLYVGFTLPRKYPRKNKKLDKQRDSPYPLLVSTIERQDYTGKKRPAFHLIQRRFPKDDWSAFQDKWITLVPIAPGGAYLDSKTRELRREYLTWQFVRFVRHYHVDYDRIVLDGGPEVLQVASSVAPMYAGIVFRGGTLTKELAATVVNFAPVPVYVLKENEALAEALKKAGHPAVTVGDGGAQLVAWLEARHRTVARTFRWRLTGREHQFANWVNVEQAHWGAPELTLAVAVDEATNTIKIDAKAIREISLFLNDEIVDLDKKVKVVVNGHLERDEMVPRDLDLLFTRDPFRLRESLYFGMLFPARLVRIGVRPAVRKPTEKPTTPTASPEVEAKAKKYFEAGKAAVDQGKLDAAKKRLQAVIDLGNTSYLERAKQLLAEIGK